MEGIRSLAAGLNDRWRRRLVHEKWREWRGSNPRPPAWQAGCSC